MPPLSPVAPTAGLRPCHALAAAAIDEEIARVGRRKVLSRTWDPREGWIEVTFTRRRTVRAYGFTDEPEGGEAAR